MNLSDIDEKYFSHPDYPYKYHVTNIAASFDENNHREAAVFHDMGKLSNAFQIFIRNITDSNKTTHTLESAFIFLKEKGYVLDKESLPVFLAILKHHGNLENVDSLAHKYNYADDITNNYPDIAKRIEEIKLVTGFQDDLDIEKCCDFFDEDFFVKAYNLSGIDEYFKIKETFSKLIFSDKYEAIFKDSFKERGENNFEAYKKRLINLVSAKQNILSIIRNKAREDALLKLNENFDKKIFILEAPTGIGKTFMALHIALEIAEKKNKKRIINALPMTSIIDQTYEEYLMVVDEDVLLKFHHLTTSKVYLKNKEFIEANEKNSELNLNRQKNLYINNSWSEDKIIITTFNQLLNLFYSNSNSDLIKFWTLRDSVIIFDEIQAIPRVLLNDFSKTINFLSKELNIDFILMSATIPDIKGFIDNTISCDLLDNKYFSFEFNNRYSMCYNPEINNDDKLIDAILNNYNDNKSVLAVVNTKKIALSIFEKVHDNIEIKNDVFLLSSLFIPKHRKIIINLIKRRLKQGRKVILISTQVVEAGVDLDFDTGFREFSPLYSIIQTAGRVNRENREDVKNAAKLIIIPKLSNFSPYDQTDLLEEDVKKLFKSDVREKDLLPLLKEYFKIAMNRTSKDGILYQKMENLEFEYVNKELNNNFMKTSPYMRQVFIEIKENLYQSFFNKLELLQQNLKNNDLSLEEKMDIKAEISDIYKKISLYVINVPNDDLKQLPSFNQTDDGMKICKYNDLKDYYQLKTGWKLTAVSCECF